jgi:hypothetical protein
MIPLNRSKNSVFRTLRRAAARCLLAAVPLAIAPAAHAGFNLTFVADPTDTDFINLLGINNSMTVAGFDNSVFNQGFTLTLPSTFAPVQFPPAGTFMTQVTGINDAGDLSGIAVNPTTGVNQGFTDIGGMFKTVDNPASTVFNQALGINNSDETVGYYAPTVTGRRRLFAERRRVHQHQCAAPEQLQQSGDWPQQQRRDCGVLSNDQGPLQLARLPR